MRKFLLLAPALLLLSACDDVPAPQPQKPQTEREKAINNTQAASVVGYDGDALKQSVQKMVDGAEKQDAKTKQATDAAATQDEPAK